MWKPIEMNDIELQWQESISIGRVTEGLGKCFLYMVEVTYSKNQSHHNHNINIEDDMRYSALVALLTHWHKWDVNKGKIISYFLTLIKSNFKFAIHREHRYPKEAQELSNDFDIGCWDEAFDNILFESESESITIDDGKWSQAKYIKSYHARRSLEDPVYLERRRTQARERGRKIAKLKKMAQEK